MAPATLLKMTPSKTQTGSNGMMGYQGSPVSGGTSTASQRNPWGQVQVPKASSSGGGSSQLSREGTQSPPSPEPSVSSTDTLTGHVYPPSAIKNSSRGSGGLNSTVSLYQGPSQTPKHATPKAFSYGSPEAMRSTSRRAQESSMSVSSPATHNGTWNGQGSAFNSPSIPHHVARGGQDFGAMYGSPVKIGQQLVRRDSTASQLGRMSYGNPQPIQRRESMVSQGTPTSQPSRHSSISTTARNSAVARSSALLHPTVNTNGQFMYAIPEGVSVQEFAFRRGQQDRGNTRDRIPPNPYHTCFDAMWETYYKKGKLSRGDAIVLPADPPSPSRANYDWPPLVNPYTQTPEHPHGIYDENFSRGVCIGALEAMEALINTVCKRGKTWQSTVCDVPRPIAIALLNYPDLLDRYEDLKSAAQEAIGGGLPFRR